jgi:hypothetical protein
MTIVSTRALSTAVRGHLTIANEIPQNVVWHETATKSWGAWLAFDRELLIRDTSYEPTQ